MVVRGDPSPIRVLSVIVELDPLEALEDRSPVREPDGLVANVARTIQADDGDESRALRSSDVESDLVDEPIEECGTILEEDPSPLPPRALDGIVPDRRQSDPSVPCRIQASRDAAGTSARAYVPDSARTSGGQVKDSREKSVLRSLVSLRIGQCE
jgi:hypothetical protein